MLARYEIRVAHRLDDEMAAVFEGLEVTADGETTVISGEMDQAALHGMLERVRMLRLELLEARRVPDTPRTATPRGPSPDPGDASRSSV
jgi:hypothetical protein